MTKVRNRFAVGVGAAALAMTALGAPSVGAERADRAAAYPQPKAGSWKLTDAFKESRGSFTVKAGAKGKNPSVKKIKITVLEQDNGADCPAPGTVLKVKGSFALRKAPKWSEDDYHNKFAWISAKKDKPYHDGYPNELGMKVVPAKVKVGSQTRSADLAISFVKVKRNKPHYADISMRLYTSDGSFGWCRFDLGKP